MQRQSALQQHNTQVWPTITHHLHMPPPTFVSRDPYGRVYFMYMYYFLLEYFISLLEYFIYVISFIRCRRPPSCHGTHIGGYRWCYVILHVICGMLHFVYVIFYFYICNIIWLDAARSFIRCRTQKLYYTHKKRILCFIYVILLMPHTTFVSRYPYTVGG